MSGARLQRRWAIWALAPVAALAVAGCRCSERSPASARAAGPTERARSEDRALLGVAAEEADTVLVEFDDREITVRDVAQELAQQRGVTRARALLPAERDRLLEWIVRDELLADEARRRGYADLPEVAQARREALARVLVLQLRREIRVPEPTEPELRARYEAEPGRWSQPELVRARVMVLRDRASAEEALETLQRALLDSRDPTETFAQFAERLGWRSPALGGDGQLGPFARPEEARPEDAHVPPPVAAAAFATPVGQLHCAVVQHGELFYLVMPIAREPPTAIPFEEAREHLRRSMREEAFAERIERLALGAHRIEIDEDALAHLADPAER